MNTLFFVGAVMILLVLVVSGHRYLQMIWWSINVFGIKGTLKDIRGLTKTYMALSNIFISSSSLLHEFKLDLYQVGMRVSCDKREEKVTHMIHSDHRLNEYSAELMRRICLAFCGDSSWILHTGEVDEQGGYEVLKIGCTDVGRFGIAPITIIYYHLTRHNQIIKTKTMRAPYGSQRNNHQRIIPIYYPTQPHLPAKHIPDITR